ncbi:MAG: peptide-methionine (S)-S-oxide reductase MsrA [Deltaproteobacteria bacterium]|nr:peptide-methionine (S)-S-oxide reductase MsrA [Deltaproteobacteria bacterium]
MNVAKNEQARAPRWTTCVALSILLAVAVAVPAAEKDPKATSTATAVFAGGCFWCMEKPFDDLEGVVSTTSGYTGGTVPNPTYEQVGEGGTGHIEAVQVVYDPRRVSYEKLLEVFWPNVDPTDGGGQFCDRGDTYLSAVFVQSDEERQLAEKSKAAAEKKKRVPEPIVTRIVQAAPFYPAEDYHQNYYQENPVRYRYYRYTCGRDERLAEVWGEDAASH